jgi:hypothetical protein
MNVIEFSTSFVFNGDPISRAIATNLRRANAIRPQRGALERNESSTNQVESVGEKRRSKISK